jgi:hypothetical protein
MANAGLIKAKSQRKQSSVHGSLRQWLILYVLCTRRHAQFCRSCVLLRVRARARGERGAQRGASRARARASFFLLPCACALWMESWLLSRKAECSVRCSVACAFCVLGLRFAVCRVCHMQLPRTARAPARLRLRRCECERLLRAAARLRLRAAARPAAAGGGGGGRRGRSAGARLGLARRRPAAARGSLPALLRSPLCGGALRQPACPWLTGRLRQPPPLRAHCPQRNGHTHVAPHSHSYSYALSIYIYIYALRR